MAEWTDLDALEAAAVDPRGTLTDFWRTRIPPLIDEVRKSRALGTPPSRRMLAVLAGLAGFDSVDAAWGALRLLEEE